MVALTFEESIEGALIIDELRALPLVPLARLAGVPVGEDSGEPRFRCPLPGHEDRHPSAVIFYGDRVGAWLWYCRVCREHGDVLDLVDHLHGGLEPDDRLDRANALARRFHAGEQPDPSTDLGGAGHSSGGRRASRPLPPAVLEAEFELLDAPGREWRAYARSKGWSVKAADWLAGQFDVRQDDDVVVLPYYTADGKLVGWAERHPERDPFPDGPISTWAKRSQGRRTALFGEHRLGSARRVVLCEGESDTLAVAWWLRGKAVAVLGLQGAVQAPDDRLLGLLRGRRVALLPDADRAGQALVERWTAALDHVLVARLPRGLDACNAGREVVLRALHKAKAPAHHRGFRVPVTPSGGETQ